MSNSLGHFGAHREGVVGPLVQVLPPDVVLTHADIDAMSAEAHIVGIETAVFRIEGPGALACVQGVFTNDVIACPPDALIWGAVLTSKGMIIFDAWVKRDADAVWMLIPAVAHAAATTMFARTFPPRIAKVQDRTGDVAVSWVIGNADHADGAKMLRPMGLAPFAGLLLGHTGRVETRDAAPAEMTPAWADAAKLLAGWPTLGREIDERTLPQEVRFDELGGVRYDKGCYTGQETVARVHFRGHPNRELRGVQWLDGSRPADRRITWNEKEVGQFASCGVINGQWLALAKIRREVDVGTTVVAGGAHATVVALPFEGV